MENVISAILLIAGLINLFPLIAVLGSSKLYLLYGVTIDDPNLLILMSHRAVLFGLLGLFLIVASWRTDFQMAAIFAGLISMLSFVILAIVIGKYNSFLNKIVWIDIYASISLLFASAIYYYNSMPLK
jgi:hypothetical protein